MPDFANITGVGSKTRSRDTSNNPFESLENEFANLLNDNIGFASTRPRVDSSIAKTLSSLDNVISNKARVLSEDKPLDEAVNDMFEDLTGEEDQNGTP